MIFEVDKTRKHFVPKLYLRGFSLKNHPDQIYVFDKDNPQAGVAVRSIENVEVSFFVCQSTQQSTVLMDSRTGRNWGQIGSSRSPCEVYRSLPASCETGTSP